MEENNYFVYKHTFPNNYESITQASKDTNINAYCIGQVCLKKRKSAGKIHWKYIN